MKKLQPTILFLAGFLLSILTASANDTLTTASGLKYIQISKGDSIHPVSNQKVKIVYTRKSSSGQVLESNELSKPFEFRVDKNKVIVGLDEIVKKMSKGEEVYCIIPPSLAYGEKGVKGSVDPNSMLYLYIQIIDIE